MSTEVSNASQVSRNTAWQLLVVDDEKECADLFARILSRDGYTVRTAVSGVEALRELRRRPADLVLADMVMPGMNGIELLANIKELYPETDVIILTGFGTIEDSLEAMRRGASDFLPKPFQPRELGRLTAACLRARRANSDEAFVRQSQSMIEIARLLTQTTDMHTLPQRAMELARENFDADSAALLAYEPVSEALSVLAHAGSGFTRWRSADLLSKQALEAVHQRGVLLSAEPDRGDCYACVPLVVAGRPRGALCLYRRGGPWFHEKSSELLEVFASHLALALESARLYENVSEQVCDIEDLLARSRSLSLKMAPDDVAGQLLVEASRMTSAEISAVLTRENGFSTVRTLPALPEDSELLRAIRRKLEEVSAQAPSANGSARGVVFSPKVRGKMLSFLHTPLARGEASFGLAGVFTSDPKGFPVEDMRRLAMLADHAAAALENAQMMTRFSAMYHESIELLSSSVDAMNAFSLGHSRQVSLFAGELARALDLPPGEVYRIEDGAMLHDIGKTCIPDSILKKPEPLTVEEFAIVKAHPIYGANMFENTPHLIDLVPVVRHHHEHYDGTGYPDRLAGNDIPLAARIVTLGDVFDALISHRPYRQGIQVQQARRMIELKAGTQFDPDIAAAFLALPLEKLIAH